MAMMQKKIAVKRWMARMRDADAGSKEKKMEKVMENVNVNVNVHLNVNENENAHQSAPVSLRAVRAWGEY